MGLTGRKNIKIVWTLMMIGELAGRQKIVGVPAWLKRADDISTKQPKSTFFAHFVNPKLKCHGHVCELP